jgi:hypothetical protein
MTGSISLGCVFGPRIRRKKMYVAIVTANIPGGASDARLKNLREVVVPRVSASPGFVNGFWSESVNDLGVSFVFFDDETSARAAVPPVGAEMGEGVTIASVEIRKVLAQA